jgi:hypothetical protein
VLGFLGLPEVFMADVKLPLSGDVMQSINPWTAWFSLFDSQIGLVNINLGRSSDPDVEKAVITEVASYGRQLGRIEDALIVLLNTYKPSRALSEKEVDAVEDLRDMLRKIGSVRRRHHADGTLALEPRFGGA